MNAIAPLFAAQQIVEVTCLVRLIGDGNGVGQASSYKGIMGAMCVAGNEGSPDWCPTLLCKPNEEEVVRSALGTASGDLVCRATHLGLNIARTAVVNIKRLAIGPY